MRPDLPVTCQDTLLLAPLSDAFGPLSHPTIRFTKRNAVPRLLEPRHLKTTQNQRSVTVVEMVYVPAWSRM